MFRVWHTEATGAPAFATDEIPASLVKFTDSQNGTVQAPAFVNDEVPELLAGLVSETGATGAPSFTVCWSREVALPEPARKLSSMIVANHSFASSMNSKLELARDLV